VSKALNSLDIHLSPFNIAQIGRSSKGLDEEMTLEEVHHDSLLTPALFQDLFTFIVRSHKAFLEMDQEHSGYITRAQAAEVMRSFGGWDSCRIALHVLAALFDSSSSYISPDTPMEFDEFAACMLSLRQLVCHFEKLKDRDHVLVSPRDLHSILLSFGTVLSVEELSMVMSRLKPEMYRMWRFSEFSDFIANLNSNVSKIRAVSSKRKVDGRKDKGKAYHKSIKNVLLVDRSQTPKIVEKLNVDALKAVLLRCRDSGTKFEDPDFPATKWSLDGIEETLEKTIDLPSHSVVSWKRPSEISPNASLFVSGPTEGDMDAGALKDTWFLSALSILTLSPNNNLSGIFLAKYPQFGLYQCRFSKDGEWHVVTVDDRLPCDSSGRPSFARSRNPDEFWVAILEKAYAKLHGSYANIQSGHTREALADLTGEVAEDSPLIYSNELWSMLQLNTKENWLMGCTHVDIAANEDALATHEDPNSLSISTSSSSAPGGRIPINTLGETTACGILKNFTYSIMRCLQIGPYKLLQLHNPWGTLHWRGAWSENAAPWSKRMLEELDVSFDDDSTFFMEFTDWCREFSHLHVLRLPSEDSQRPWEKIFIAGEWRYDSAGGCTNFPSWTLNHQFRFTSSHHEPTTVFLSLSHKDRRLMNSKARLSDPSLRTLPSLISPVVYPSHGLIVMKASEGEDANTKKDRASPNDLEAINTFQNARDNALEFTALPNTSYIIVPATYQPGVIGSYFFRIQTRHKAKVVPLMTMKANKAVEGSWQAIKGTNGGSINYPSWRNSPQYLLRVFQESKLRVMLLQQEKTPLPPIAFSIFNADSSERRKLELADLVLLPEKYIVSTSVSGDLTLPAGCYNIVASTETPDFENTFKLQVQGNPDSLAIEPLREYKRIHLRDYWTAETAGGCRNHPTWVKNPHFLFSVPPPGGPITIVVAYTEIFKDSAIGFYLFNADAKNSRASLLGKSKFTHVSVATTFNLAPANYILLPCSFNPGIVKEFTIEFYSDLSITNIAKMKFSANPGSIKLPKPGSSSSSSSSSSAAATAASSSQNPSNESNTATAAPSQN
jgi:hypothetical protein